MGELPLVEISPNAIRVDGTVIPGVMRVRIELTPGYREVNIVIAVRDVVLATGDDWSSPHAFGGD